MTRVRWGIIGIGGIARRRLAPELVRYGRNAELVAVMGLDVDNPEALAREFGARRWYTSEEELLADPEVEAVYVATPNHLHHRQVLMAARAGKHVLCEKPLGLDVAQAQEMVDACHAAGVKLGTGFMMRFHAAHRRAGEMLRDGLLGRPVFARAQLSCWYPPIEGAWRQAPALGGGGALMDMASHCIDLLEALLDSRVRSVAAVCDRVVHPYAAEDTSVVLLRFANGATGVVDACYNLPDAAVRNRLEVYGSAGSLLAEGTVGQDSGGRMILCHAPQGAYDAGQQRVAQTPGESEVAYEPVSLYAAEADAFSACIREGTEPPVSGDDGLWSQRVMAACYEAARSGSVVKV